MTKVNGMAVTFAMDLKFVAVDKPDGYSRQKQRSCLTAMPVQMIILQLQIKVIIRIL